MGKFNFPVDTRKNIASSYFSTSKDSVCSEIMVLFGFGITEEAVTYDGDILSKEASSFRVTPYVFSDEEVSDIESILNKEYNHAPNASPLLDCLGWIIREEFGYYKIRYALSSLYEFWAEPLVPWDFDIEEYDINWRDGDDWEDGLDLSKDLPRHWITKEILMELYPELTESLTEIKEPVET